MTEPSRAFLSRYQNGQSGVGESLALKRPLLEALRPERRVAECALVIFGANGDLTKRKLMPALYQLAYDQRLSPQFAVIGVSRTPFTDEQFRNKMLLAVKEFSEGARFDENVWRSFASGLFYVSGDIGDAQLFQTIAARLPEIEAARYTRGNVVFYLSTHPSQYATAVRNLRAAGLSRGNGLRRVIIEKPFGSDLASARALSDELNDVLDESQIYRMDHYLGKETVQNILAFRFANGIFEPLWNARYVNHVQITAAESVGVEGRGAYYQETGALVDMIQNHLLQVMAAIAMEPSASVHAPSVCDQRSKVVRSIQLMNRDEIRENTVAGQYARSRIGGKVIPEFRQEPGIDRDARTDTYAAVTFFIENERWAGVPFYLRTGKRMPKRVTEVAIQFNSSPVATFNASGVETMPNLLIMRIEPDEGISLRFLSKRPGTGMQLRPVSMDFNYNSSHGERSPLAYENLLLDAIFGNATLYTRQDMVEASWNVIEGIRNAWQESNLDFPNYAAGTWGPVAADEMLARRGHVWRTP